MDIAVHQLDLARQFAAALDACDYALAAEFLSETCRYERPGKPLLLGPRAICDSYHASDEHARKQFDGVTYSSEVTANTSGGVRLTFADEVRRGDATHTFRCAQIVYLDESDKIARIELREIPGERERLSNFCAAYDV